MTSNAAGAAGAGPVGRIIAALLHQIARMTAGHRCRHEVRSILQARTASNDAIRAHDAAHAVAVMSADVQVMVSTGQLVVGREAMQRAFARSFADPDFITYVRRPRSIEVGDGVAAERGRWTALSRGRTREGAYLARWQKADGEWRIVGEIYVPLVSAITERSRRAGRLAG